MQFLYCLAQFLSHHLLTEKRKIICMSREPNRKPMLYPLPLRLGTTSWNCPLALLAYIICSGPVKLEQLDQRWWHWTEVTLMFLTQLPLVRISALPISKTFLCKLSVVRPNLSTIKPLVQMRASQHCKNKGSHLFLKKCLITDKLL